ncbi:MAG: hypothetical protein FWK04_19490 [Nostoc sp. GBBB01]|nr:hypothetical protein [Nostoc sp. GBBB01]
MGQRAKGKGQGAWGKGQGVRGKGQGVNERSLLFPLTFPLFPTRRVFPNAPFPNHLFYELLSFVN